MFDRNIEPIFRAGDILLPRHQSRILPPKRDEQSTMNRSGMQIRISRNAIIRLLRSPQNPASLPGVKLPTITANKCTSYRATINEIRRPTRTTNIIFVRENPVQFTLLLFFSLQIRSMYQSPPPAPNRFRTSKG